MKKRVFFTCMVLLILAGAALAYTSGHSFINGNVRSIDSDTITIEDRTYTIDPKCKVVIAYKEQDSFHERPARVSDIVRGDTVTAKKIANTLYEIMIERWR